jgi:hypothetical protein
LGEIHPRSGTEGATVAVAVLVRSGRRPRFAIKTADDKQPPRPWLINELDLRSYELKTKNIQDPRPFLAQIQKFYAKGDFVYLDIQIPADALRVAGQGKALDSCLYWLVATDPSGTEDRVAFTVIRQPQAAVVAGP